MSDTPSVRQSSIAHPFTGEVIDLGDVHETTLAEWRDGLGERRRWIDEVNAQIDRELTDRLDHENRRSAKFGDWEVETQAPFETSWDVASLGLELEALVQAGTLTRNAAEAALKPTTTYKPVARELKKLLDHADPEVRDAVARCRHSEPRRRRRVTVKRTLPERRLSAAGGPQEATE